MYKICIILPYFGKLPNYFTAWLQTAKKNISIDFLIFKDDDTLKSDMNIKVIHISLENLFAKIQEKYSFEIVKNPRAYKLCDFRPAYGEIFSEEIAEYDFWGYGDIDLLYGDIRKFITDEKLDEFDCCLNFGHLAFYRNCKKINELYKSEGEYPEKNYKEVFSKKDAYYFDEYGGMQFKKIRNNISVFDEVPILNLLPVYPFWDEKGKSIIIVWENNHLYSVDESLNKHELLYAHYSKRQFEVCQISGIQDMNITSIIVTPTKIYYNIPVDNEMFKKNTKYENLYRLKYMLYRIMHSKNSIIKNIFRMKWSKDISK